MFVRLEVLLFFDRWGRGCGTTGITSLCGDIHERQNIRIDHAELRLRTQLATKQARGFKVTVHVLGATGDEPGNEHALKCRNIQLGPDGRFDRDLERVRAGRGQQNDDETTERLDGSCDH